MLWVPVIALAWGPWQRHCLESYTEQTKPQWNMALMLPVWVRISATLCGHLTHTQPEDVFSFWCISFSVPRHNNLFFGIVKSFFFSNHKPLRPWFARKCHQILHQLSCCEQRTLDSLTISMQTNTHTGEANTYTSVWPCDARFCKRW